MIEISPAREPRPRPKMANTIVSSNRLHEPICLSTSRRFGCNFGANFLVDCSCTFLLVIFSRARLRRSDVR
jgi:hypothetical protein